MSVPSHVFCLLILTVFSHAFLFPPPIVLFSNIILLFSMSLNFTFILTPIFTFILTPIFTFIFTLEIGFQDHQVIRSNSFPSSNILIYK